MDPVELGKSLESKSGLIMVCDVITGRQLRPLSSVLYRIISERRYILAAQLLLRDKSGTERSGTDSNIPILPAGLMIFICWNLKMSYHTAYPVWDF